MTKKRQPAVVAIKKLPSPARSITNMGPIRTLLEESVLDQSTATYRLSYTMSATLYRGEQYATTTIWMLSGPSGTGKTTSAKVMRHILGMDEGYEYEEQYVTVDASKKKDDTTEPANKKCYDMIEGLNNAIKTPVPFIMLFIHAFDEACQELKLMISSLVCHSKCDSPNGKEKFTRPSKTGLIIVCTARYGSVEISEMKMKNDDVAKSFIIKNMRSTVPSQLIERIHLTMPFYPLSTATMRDLLSVRLDTYMQNSRLVQIYGTDQLSSKPEVKEMLINHVLQKIDTGEGMHSRVVDLEVKLNSLIEAAINVIESMQNSRHRKTKDMIYLEKFSFDTERFDEMLSAELDKVTRGFLSSIQTNPDNQLFFDAHDPGKSGKVDTLTMRYGEETPLCGLIMNINYITVNNYFTDEESVKVNDTLKESMKRLETRNKKLKGCLQHITAAAAKGHNKAINTIIKNNQELINESSDDSGEEKQPVLLLKRKAHEDRFSTKSKKPRVEEVEEEEEAAAVEIQVEEIEELTYYSDEGVSSLEEVNYMDLLITEEESMEVSNASTLSTIGEAHIGVENFTRGPLKNKAYTWHCNNCGTVVTKIQYTRTHICNRPSRRKHSSMK